MKHQHTPTRSCPHRYYRTLHTAAGISFAIFGARLLFNGLDAAVWLAVCALIGLTVSRLVHGKNVLHQVVDEAIEKARGVHLIVRPGWALFAVILDGLYVDSSLLRDNGALALPTPDVNGFAAIGVAAAVVALYEFAHRQATRPARPKTVLATARGGA